MDADEHAAFLGHGSDAAYRLLVGRRRDRLHAQSGRLVEAFLHFLVGPVVAKADVDGIDSNPGAVELAAKVLEIRVRRLQPPGAELVAAARLRLEVPLPELDVWFKALPRVRKRRPRQEF